MRVKLEETRRASAEGADEIDMVIDRGAFLSGRYAKVFDEIVRVKEACGAARLKVILEVSELGTYDNVRRASLLAMAAGGDFIKTSTGKLPGAATLPVQLVMLEAIRDVYEETGRKVGMKAAGGTMRSRWVSVSDLMWSPDTARELSKVASPESEASFASVIASFSIAPVGIRSPGVVDILPPLIAALPEMSPSTIAASNLFLSARKLSLTSDEVSKLPKVDGGKG